MGIDLFPWHHYHVVSNGEKSVSLKAYSQAHINTKTSFFLWMFCCKVEEKNVGWLCFGHGRSDAGLFVLKRQKK